MAAILMVFYLELGSLPYFLGRIGHTKSQNHTMKFIKLRQPFQLPTGSFKKPFTLYPDIEPIPTSVTFTPVSVLGRPPGKSSRLGALRLGLSAVAHVSGLSGEGAFLGAGGRSEK